MKIGDKVYCTHDFYSNLQRMFTTNKIYTIKVVYPDSDRIAIINDKNGLSLFHTTTIHSLYQFGDYFILQQEHRKQKLLKLNSL